MWIFFFFPASSCWALLEFWNQGISPANMVFHHVSNFWSQNVDKTRGHDRSGVTVKDQAFPYISWTGCIIADGFGSLLSTLLDFRPVRFRRSIQDGV